MASSQNIVSDGGQISHKTQYITAVAATLGALSMGAILGYSSPASPQLSYNNDTNSSDIRICNGDLSLSLETSEISWFGSTVNIGALIGAPLGGFAINFIGRRLTMVSSIVPFLLGWLLIGMYIISV